MRIRIAALLVLILIPVTSFCQVKKLNREILLLCRKNSAGEVTRYNYIWVGDKITCLVKRDSAGSKYQKLKGRITFADTSYLLLDSAKIEYKDIFMISTYSAGKIIRKVAGIAIIIGGVITSEWIFATMGPAGMIILPPSLAAGIILMRTRSGRFYFNSWSCSNALYGDFIRLNKDLKQKQSDKKRMEKIEMMKGRIPGIK